MWMRTFKAFNALLRALRVLRVVHVFREIRVLIVSVAHALRSLVWVVMAQMLLMYMFALLLVNGVSAYLLHADKGEVSEDVERVSREYWGTLPRALLTLYESVTGGGPWRTVTSPLLAAGPMQYTLFLLYIALLVLVVLRLFTGVLVQHAKDALASDREANIAQNLKAWFKGLDEDGSGKMSLEELMDFIKFCSQGAVRKEVPSRVSGLLGGMRGELPPRSPSRRPGTLPDSPSSHLPFCLNGRERASTGRLASTTDCWLARADSEPTLPSLSMRRSQESFRQGLPSISSRDGDSSPKGAASSSRFCPCSFQPDVSCIGMGSTARSLSLQSVREKRVWNGKFPGKVRGGYMLLKGARSLNQVEERLFEAGIDVRGNYHKIGRYGEGMRGNIHL